MSTPHDVEARKYYRVAMQRLAEADLVLDQVKLFRAAIYLGGYAVECILKALLLSNTPPGSRSSVVTALKRDFGHNLQLLQEGVRRRGVQIPSQVARGIRLAGVWSPELRYEPGPGDQRDAEQFLDATRMIVEWADRSM